MLVQGTFLTISQHVISSSRKLMHTTPYSEQNPGKHNSLFPHWVIWQTAWEAEPQDPPAPILCLWCVTDTLYMLHYCSLLWFLYDLGSFPKVICLGKRCRPNFFNLNLLKETHVGKDWDSQLFSDSDRRYTLNSTSIRLGGLMSLPAEFSIGRLPAVS